MKKSNVTGKNVKKREKNYNGQPLKDGEVLVAMNLGDTFTEVNVTNAENKVTVGIIGHRKKATLAAVPKEWEKAAKSQLNLETNEELGHYDTPNSVSMDAVGDKYGMAFGEAPSAEEEYHMKESVKNRFDRLREIIKKKPKIGYACLLTMNDIKGAEFYKKMKLERTAADRYRGIAKKALEDGILKFDVESVRCYRSDLDAEYKEEALKLLDMLVELYKKYC